MLKTETSAEGLIPVPLLQIARVLEIPIFAKNGCKLPKHRSAQQRQSMLGGSSHLGYLLSLGGNQAHLKLHQPNFLFPWMLTTYPSSWHDPPSMVLKKIEKNTTKTHITGKARKFLPNPTPAGVPAETSQTSQVENFHSLTGRGGWWISFFSGISTTFVSPETTFSQKRSFNCETHEVFLVLSEQRPLFSWIVSTLPVDYSFDSIWHAGFLPKSSLAARPLKKTCRRGNSAKVQPNSNQKHTGKSWDDLQGAWFSMLLSFDHLGCKRSFHDIFFILTALKLGVWNDKGFHPVLYFKNNANIADFSQRFVFKTFIRARSIKLPSLQHCLQQTCGSTTKQWVLITYKMLLLQPNLALISLLP